MPSVGIASPATMDAEARLSDVTTARGVDISRWVATSVGSCRETSFMHTACMSVTLVAPVASTGLMVNDTALATCPDASNDTSALLRLCVPSKTNGTSARLTVLPDTLVLPGCWNVMSTTSSPGHLASFWLLVRDT